MVDFLCDLPECISASICTIWLDVKCLSFLDNAYCTKEKRSVYLDLLRSDGFILEYPVSSNTVRVMSWICQRSVRISFLQIFGEILPVCSVLLEKSGKTLRMLVLHGIRDESWSRLKSVCTDVSQLYFVRCTLREGLLSFVSQCAHLICLRFQNCLRDQSSLETTPCKSVLFLEIVSDLSNINQQYFLSAFQLGTSAVEVVSIDTPNANPQSVLEMIRARFSHMKAIDIKTNYISDRSLTEVFQSCKYLTHIGLPPSRGSLTDATLYAIADNLQVTVLDLSENSRFTDAGLLRLVETQSTVLQCIYLDGTSVTATGVEELVKNCKKLRRLSLPWNVNQDRLAVHALPYCSNLKSLAFAYRIRLKDSLLFALAHHCPHIENLALFVDNKAIAGVSAVMEKCTRLRNVVVNKKSLTINEVAQKAWSLLRPGLKFSVDVDGLLENQYYLKASDKLHCICL